jgi:hypothetical protein
VLHRWDSVLTAISKQSERSAQRFQDQPTFNDIVTPRFEPSRPLSQRFRMTIADANTSY